MKQWLGKFIFDFVTRLLGRLDDEAYITLMSRVKAIRLFRKNTDLTEFSKIRRLPENERGKNISIPRYEK